MGRRLAEYKADNERLTAKVSRVRRRWCASVNSRSRTRYQAQRLAPWFLLLFSHVLLSVVQLAKTVEVARTSSDEAARLRDDAADLRDLLALTTPARAYFTRRRLQKCIRGRFCQFRNNMESTTLEESSRAPTLADVTL